MAVYYSLQNCYLSFIFFFLFLWGVCVSFYKRITLFREKKTVQARVGYTVKTDGQEYFRTPIIVRLPFMEQKQSCSLRGSVGSSFCCAIFLWLKSFSIGYIQITHPLLNSYYIMQFMTFALNSVSLLLPRKGRKGRKRREKKNERRKKSKQNS